MYGSIGFTRRSRSIEIPLTADQQSRLKELRKQAERLQKEYLAFPFDTSETILDEKEKEIDIIETQIQDIYAE